jgi:hypothetical protein
LDSELNDGFYKLKIKLNPTLKPPPQAFIEFLQMWIENIDLVKMRVEANLLRYPLQVCTSFNVG